MAHTVVSPLGDSLHPETRGVTDASPAQVTAAEAAEARKHFFDSFRRLQVIAQRVGGDFGMEVRVGRAGEGSYFSSQDNSITLDPLHIIKDPELAEFVTSHEGSHRGTMVTFNELGLAPKQVESLYSRPGFGFVQNITEDGACNDWKDRSWPGLHQGTRNFYAKQFEDPDAVLSTPEVVQMYHRLGRWPLFARYGSEILRDWNSVRTEYGVDSPLPDPQTVAPRFSPTTPPEVLEALNRTIGVARECISSIPSPCSRSKPEIKSCHQRRFKLNAEHLYPEVEQLTNLDLGIETGRQTYNEFQQKLDQLEQLKKQLQQASSNGADASSIQSQIDQLQEDLAPFEAIPEAVRQELERHVKEAIRQQVQDFVDKIQQSAEEISQSRGEQEKLQKAIDSLSDQQGDSSEAQSEQLDNLQEELDLQKARESAARKELDSHLDSSLGNSPEAGAIKDEIKDQIEKQATGKSAGQDQGFEGLQMPPADQPDPSQNEQGGDNEGQSGSEPSGGGSNSMPSSGGAPGQQGAAQSDPGAAQGSSASDPSGSSSSGGGSQSPGESAQQAGSSQTSPPSSGGSDSAGGAASDPRSGSGANSEGSLSSAGGSSSKEQSQGKGETQADSSIGDELTSKIEQQIEKDARANGELPMPYEKLSDEGKSAVEKMVNEAPQEQFERCNKKAKEELQKFEKAANDAIRGKLNEDPSASGEKGDKSGSRDTNSGDGSSSSESGGGASSASGGAGKSPTDLGDLDSGARKAQAGKPAMPAKTQHSRRTAPTEAPPSIGSVELPDLKKTREKIQQVVRARSQDPEEYIQAEKEFGPSLERLQRTFRRILQPNHDDQLSGGHSSGTLDMKKAIRIQREPQLIGELFNRWSDPIEISHAFGTLVDRSTSMAEEEKRWVAYCAALLQTKLLDWERLNVPNCTWVYSDDQYCVKDFDDNVRSPAVRERFGAILRVCGGTQDAPAVQRMYRHLLSRPEKFKFLPIITDAGSGTIEELRTTVGQIMAAGEVVLVHFGLGSGTVDPNGIFPYSFGDLAINPQPGEIGFADVYAAFVAAAVRHPKRFFDYRNPADIVSAITEQARLKRI